MKGFILFLAGIACALATPAALGQFPYHASLFATDGESFKICDGALIRHNWIISAAHCMHNKITVTVELGVIDLWRATPQYTETVDTLANPSYLQIHPSFDYYLNPFHDDIALLFLPAATPAIITGNINTINLPLAGDTNTAGLTGTLTGFGYEEPEYDYTLRFISFPIMTNSWCQLMHGDRIIDSKMCVDTLNDPSPCLEGNGGPLTATVGGRHVIVGIGSIWETLCTNSHHGIFTRITSHLGWINGVIN